MKYNSIILGGTFDHFHKGHIGFINQAFSIGKKVTIGLTQKNLHKNKCLSKTIESYSIRRYSLLDYLKKNKWAKQTKIIPISDIYGTTLIDKDIDAIIVSKATYNNAVKINKKRKEKQYPKLKIVLAPNVLGNDKKIITSKRIRKGEINKDGYNYFSLFNNNKKLVLPYLLRKTLRVPIGKIIKGEKMFEIIKKTRPTITIAVGDIVSKSLIENKIIPDISIVDFKTRRKKIKIQDNIITTNYSVIKKCNNPAGAISKESALTINNALSYVLKTKKKQAVIIKGEEDLTALCAMLFSPLNSLVLYGQYNLGTVLVYITQEKKNEVLKILKQFDIIR